MEAWQKKIVEWYIKELVKADANAIDMISMEAGLSQNVVYNFYLHFHHEFYLKMIGENKGC